MKRLVQWLLLVLCVLALFGALSTALVSAQSDTNVFGVIEGFWLPDVVCELNPGWERIIFDWSQHQPTGPDDWHTLNVDDRWLKAANDCNREVVALLKHTPDWATDGMPGPGVPLGLYLPVDDPDNLWANFVREAAHYYASRGVRRFIIWNEPDITADTYGFEFEGTLDDYFQMVKVAYLAAKEGNPDAIIHLAGTTYWHDVNAGRRLYVDRLLERIMQDPDAEANDYYFDVMSLHVYFRTDSVYDIVREMRSLLDGYGLTDKHIWINEMNAPPTLDPQWPVERPVYQLNLEQQANFLVQAAALGLAAGADHMAVYKFYDWSLPVGGETFGLLRADASRRPAFDAWATVIAHLNGVDSAALSQTDEVDVVRLEHFSGRETIVTWARTAESAQVQVGATSDKAYLIDAYGGVTMIRPNEVTEDSAGFYTLFLDGALCNNTDGCPVGGAVSMLIQPHGDITIQEITTEGAQALAFE